MPQVLSNMFWRNPLFNPLNDRHAWNSLGQLINRRWSLTECRASVLSVAQECPDVISLHLRPNRLFKGFTPGQHLALTLPVNGVLKSRTFSLSKAPSADGSLRLTIKIKADGQVSKAAKSLKKGDVVIISQASGDFTHRLPKRNILLLSAGSGITPMMAMLQDWAGMAEPPQATLVHVCQAPDAFIFNAELQTLVQQYPGLSVIPVYTAESGRLDATRLQQLVPDFALLDTLLCGPPSFMAWVADFYAEQGLSAHLKQEHFQPRITPIRPDAETYTAFTAEGNAAFTARQGQTLLEAAEAGGLKPTHGCRRGICMTCQCKKLAGVVHNQLTNTFSGSGEEWIQLCISTPVSDLHLELAKHG